MTDNIKNKFNIQVSITEVRSLILLAIAINLIIETFNRRSIVSGMKYLITSPISFLYGVSIILLTLSFAKMFKKSQFFIILVSTVWVGLGVANFVLQTFRTTPLTSIDIRMLGSVFTVIGVYFTPIQIIILGVLISFVAFLVMLSWFRVKRRRIYISNVAITLLLSTLLIVFIPSIAYEEEQQAIDFRNLVEAYDRYGFVHCFSSGLLNQGIDEPDQYSQEYVESIVNKLSIYQEREFKESNIIFLQLESVFDVNNLKGISFSDNPLPYFTYLYENYSSGKLRVPSVGAGTANTEFEILTGMNLDFFGAGEYPYKSVLIDNATDSIGFTLTDLGYEITAIHNNYGAFYNRHEVFKNLGFDNFISIESMNGVEFNPVGWAKDEILTEEILRVMEKTESLDFIFAISVQPHGTYPSYPVEMEYIVSIETPLENERLMSLNYFINQLYQVDIFLKELTYELSSYHEPVTLVIYGDHFPSLGITNEDLIEGTVFDTEYILWTNYGAEKVDKNLEAYQLGSYVLERLSINHGLINSYHQENKGEDDYQEHLKVLQYDLLFGEKFATEHEYEPKDTLMGIEDVVINEIAHDGGAMYIIGEGFTPFSFVFIDGRKQDTIFLSETVLMVEDHRNFDSIIVAQIGMKDIVLRESNIYTE